MLMTKQTEDDYKIVLNVFNNFTIENNINFENNNELKIITDFEKALINAINDVFPFVMHSACFFHFCQNIWRHIQKEGLSTIYKVHGRPRI
jgi:transposase-like protein